MNEIIERFARDEIMRSVYNMRTVSTTDEGNIYGIYILNYDY